MDAISALIGAGSSIVGGFMNTSSAQSINSANIQQARSMAQGDYLPNLVFNAQKAGLSPLAVLGSHTPGFSASTPTDPGAGVIGAGKSLMELSDRAHVEKMQGLAERKAETDIQALNAGITNTNIEMARNKYALDQLRAHPEWLAPGNSQPAKDTSFPAPQVQWLSDFAHRFDGVYGPQPPNLSPSDYSTP